MGITDVGADTVIVVGAGLSGLTTAKALRDNGVRAVVVEANDRVGGRTWTVEEPGGPLDLGGMFIGIGHAESIALGTSLGLKMTPAYVEGDMIYRFAHGPVRAKETALEAAWDRAGQLEDAFQLFDQLATEVGPDEPWNHPQAADLDGMSVATWVERHCTDPEVRAVLNMEVGALVGADASEVSMLYWCWYVAACGGVRSIRFDVNDSMWVGGSQQISDLLGQGLGDDLHLNWPAQTVRQDDAGVSVSSGEHILRGGYVVLAIPPHSAHRIIFEPMLEQRRMQFQMRAPFGRFAKVQARYAEPFWRADGLSGTYCSTTGIACIGVEAQRPTDTASTLVSFIGGSSYDQFVALDADTRRKLMLDQLVAIFGPQAAEPDFYHEMLWSFEPWQQGGPTYFLPPGAFLPTAGARTEPIGRIHFAGTEAARRFPGFMEGAVQAGNDVAERLTKLVRS